MAVRIALLAGEPHVLQVPTRPNAPRAAARSAVRAALCKWLSQQLELDVGAHDFAQDSGGPLRWEPRPGALRVHYFQFSIAHAPGLSLIAIYTGAAVGVDLLRQQEIPESYVELKRLLADYAGPQATARFARQMARNPADTPALFAKAWTALEAATKGNGSALNEWHLVKGEAQSPMLLRQCTLGLPSGYFGHLAWRD